MNQLRIQSSHRTMWIIAIAMVAPVVATLTLVLGPYLIPADSIFYVIPLVAHVLGIIISALAGLELISRLIDVRRRNRDMYQP